MPDDSPETDSAPRDQRCRQCDKPLPAQCADPLCPQDDVSNPDLETQIFHRETALRSRSDDEKTLPLIPKHPSDGNKTEPVVEAAPSKVSPEEEIGTLKNAFPGLVVESVIGQGGMGSVYLARQVGENRPVALKVLPREMEELPGFSLRFEREGQTMALLDHPNLVGIHDFGINESGQYFLAMEYVDGEGLDSLIAKGAVSPEESSRILGQICDALQFAHDKGIIHRDIKPGNILLNSEGQVKVADFGLAKMISDKNPDISITLTGYVVGTPEYMAPEQYEGGDAVDHRADLYALGTVLYQLLTGKLPWGSYDPPSRLLKVDPRVDEVVAKAMENDLELRYQQASEIKSDLEEIFGESRDAIDQKRTSPKSTLLIAAIVTLLIGVIAWIAVLLFPG